MPDRHLKVGYATALVQYLLGMHSMPNAQAEGLRRDPIKFDLMWQAILYLPISTIIPILAFPSSGRTIWCD